MANEKRQKNNTSWFTENWEEIRKELIKDVEKVNKLKKEVMKIYQEQISFSEQISAAVEKATTQQTKWEKIFDLDDPLVEGLREKMKQDEEIKKLAKKYVDDPEKQELVDAILEARKNDWSGLNGKDGEGGWLYETLGDTGAIFKDELVKSLSDFENFGDGMKALGNEIANYMIQKGIDSLSQVVAQAIQASKIVQQISAGSKAASGGSGIWSKVGSAIGTFFGGKKHHSGGVIVPDSSMLPGTQEQLAMLKGGERVLSPSEAASYNSSEGGQQPVVFVNYSIKAWDSKDVSKYLTDNASLINSITAQGIRDNKHYLRTMIRNA